MDNKLICPKPKPKPKPKAINTTADYTNRNGK